MDGADLRRRLRATGLACGRRTCLCLPPTIVPTCRVVLGEVLTRHGLQQSEARLRTIELVSRSRGKVNATAWASAFWRRTFNPMRRAIVEPVRRERRGLGGGKPIGLRRRLETRIYCQGLIAPTRRLAALEEVQRRSSSNLAGSRLFLKTGSLAAGEPADRPMPPVGAGSRPSRPRRWGTRSVRAGRLRRTGFGRVGTMFHS